MIPIKKEPDLGMPGLPMELCCFCRTPTDMWYVKKDVAVCTGCAKTHKVSEVPSKKEWFKKERSLSNHHSM